MVKRFALFAVIVCFLMTLLGCSKTAEDKLEHFVEYSNKYEVPDRWTNDLTLVSVSMEHHSLVFNFLWTERSTFNLIDNEAQANKIVEALKMMTLKNIGVSSIKDRDVFDLCVEAGYSLELILKGSDTGKKIKTSISPAELHAAMEF